MISAKVLRINLSEVYQSLNAQSILSEMVERKLIQPQKRGEAEGYSSKYAQNISAGVTLFNKKSFTHIHIRSLQYSRGHRLPQTEEVSSEAQIRSGIYCRVNINCLDAAITFSFRSSKDPFNEEGASSSDVVPTTYHHSTIRAEGARSPESVLTDTGSSDGSI